MVERKLKGALNIKIIMLFHFTWLILVIAGVLGIGIIIGMKTEINAFADLMGPNDYTKNEKYLIQGMWLAPFCMIVWFGILFGLSYTDVRKEFINKYKNNTIIEQVSYKYDIVNDQKVLVDSTFVYKRK